MTQNENVIDLDDLLTGKVNEPQTSKEKPTKKPTNKGLKSSKNKSESYNNGLVLTDDGRVQRKVKTVTELENDREEKKKFELASNSISSLNRISKNILESYIKRTPKMKTTMQQIKILEQKQEEYETGGNKKAVNDCKFLINELKKAQGKYRSLIVPKTKEENEEMNERIKKSERLKDLKKEQKELIEEYSNLNPMSLYKKVLKLRELLDFKENHYDIFVKPDKDDDIYVGKQDNEVIDLDSIDDEELDEIIENDLKVKNLLTNYKQLCRYIGDLVGKTEEDIMKLNTNELKKTLKHDMDDEVYSKVEELKNAIDLNKLESSKEIKRIKGYDDITDVMFEIFDFETEEEAPKEMLAAANVKYVEGIAYKICSSLNMLHYYADAISYGLLGLSLAINRWYKIQKFTDQALSFEGFAHKDIAFTIKRGLYELSSSGTISGSSWANKNHNYNKKYEFWIKNNQDLKDLPKEMLKDIFEGIYDNGPQPVMTESAFKAMVGGSEDEDKADIWSNALSTNKTHEDTITESKGVFIDIANSLKSLFSLFETKTDKQTGIKEITKKKVFDKYDYYTFFWNFGLITKEDGKPYKQDEIGEMLWKMKKADGINTIKIINGKKVDKPDSQSAISDRIKKILIKINRILDERPEMKKGFEYLMYYASSNRENMRILSASKEELGVDYSDYQNKKKTEDEKFQEAKMNGQQFAENYDYEDDEIEANIADEFEDE